MAVHFRQFAIINRGGTAMNLAKTKPSIKIIEQKLKVDIFKFTNHMTGSRDKSSKGKPYL